VRVIEGAFAGLAALAAQQGQFERALRLAAGAAARAQEPSVRFAVDWSIEHGVTAQLDPYLAPAYRALTPDEQAAARTAGERMTPEELFELALAGEPVQIIGPAASERIGAARARRAAAAPAAPATGRSDNEPAPATEASRLSAREQQVAVLVARGLTNKQIAAELVVAESTAARHVEHILAKLGLRARVQIGAWAVARGLLVP
jgi:DNA-binding CsgD family transcriptional regulator